MIDVSQWRVRGYDPAFPNEAFIDIPYGYIEIGGFSSSKREAIAELIVKAIRSDADLREERAYAARLRSACVTAVALLTTDIYRDEGDKRDSEIRKIAKAIYSTNASDTPDPE